VSSSCFIIQRNLCDTLAAKMAHPAEPVNRFKGFAQFFKGYMGVMPIITAAVAPIVTSFKTIPVFDVQKNDLALYSGLLGFLLIGYIFYARASSWRNV
jgi:hypothetical protein